MITDTHAHLTMSDEPVEALVERAHEADVSTIITIGIDLASSAEATQVAAVHPGVWSAVGIHPHNAIEATDGVLARLADLARSDEVVAIGETGLDYFRDHAPRIRQEESFRSHIRLAKELDKALVIHNREAHEDIVAILRDEIAPERTILHAFSGGVELVNVCAEHGWFISFAGNVTFRNAEELRVAAKAAPPELLLTETDMPYLSPHPLRGKPNEPARVRFVVDQLAELHGMAPEAMARLTSANARRAFALPDEG